MPTRPSPPELPYFNFFTLKKPQLHCKKAWPKGVLRDAHGVLVLEFQRPDDPLDVQMELAELIISRDEVQLCGFG